jgi:hypothetical protein
MPYHNDLEASFDEMREFYAIRAGFEGARDIDHAVQHINVAAYSGSHHLW